MSVEEELGELEGELVDAVSTVERVDLASADKLNVAFSRKLRRLAVLQFAEHEDVGELRSTLSRSALVREAYLERCAGQDVSSLAHYAIGRYQALLDAIAAHRWDRAGAIVSLSPTTWQKGKEARADFLYGSILSALVTDRREDARALYEELRAEDDAYSRVRCAVFGAMLGATEGGLEAAFRPLVAESSDPVVVEGVALLVLAKRMGLEVPAGLDRCPEVLVEA